MSESISDLVKMKPRGERRAPVDADRLPPHDEPSERAVISCLFQKPQESLAEILASGAKNIPQHFYDLRYRTIAGAMIALHDEDLPVDVVTVSERLELAGVLQQLGGFPALLELEDAAPSAANIGAYWKIVRDKYRLRQLIQCCSDIVGQVYDDAGAQDAEKLLVESEARISRITEVETPTTEKTMAEVMQLVAKDMEEWHYTRGSQQLRGLPTGPKGNYLDKVLTGIRESQYVVIAARPGMGKSSIAFNIVEHLAEHHEWYEPTGKMIPNPDFPDTLIPEMVPRKGVPVAVFSIEMDNESLGYRLAFGRAGVSEAKFNQGYAEKGAEERLVKAVHDLGKLKIYLDDTPAQTIGQIAAKARRMAKQHGIKLFVLDYLQLAQGDDPRDEKRVQVDKISKKIMALKKQLKVPWIVLAQLNRNIETAERDRNPVLSDLAESGSIEQDADKVIILKASSRKDLEADKTADDGSITCDKEILDALAAKHEWDWSVRPRRVDAWVVKNRRGPTGKAEFVFQGNLCRFTDWHMFKVAHGVEARKEGESKHMTDELPHAPALAGGALPSDAEMAQ